MKNTGVTRNIDDLGRIVIPMEIRNNLGIKQKDGMDIYINGNDIILRKSQQECTFCGSKENLIVFKNQKICDKCYEEMKEVFSNDIKLEIDLH